MVDFFFEFQIYRININKTSLIEEDFLSFLGDFFVILDNTIN